MSVATLLAESASARARSLAAAIPGHQRRARPRLLSAADSGSLVAPPEAHSEAFRCSALVQRQGRRVLGVGE
eukprot:CAMPEP_0176266632 /NCGR_PEP_ID=MMETSP0121_2-20121125/42746_1 /TAXON_ID=160619 /ORGANISM="Kryptoperidinium foliaceum, Strain CCMP 1326" /LENGTH=71 /DNA_ID=CAMNT_0017606675 /DNA_START=29 /DNA_END=241 /DNA_ORIENTATION=-